VVKETLEHAGRIVTAVTLAAAVLLGAEKVNRAANAIVRGADALDRIANKVAPR
jgi:glutamate synthase domain-containing protein 2